MASELSVAVVMHAERLTSIETVHAYGVTRLEGNAVIGGGCYQPMELLLISLAECAAYDLFAFLRRLDVAPEQLEVRVRATQRAEQPQVLTHIHLEFLLHATEVDAEMAARAIDQTRTYYCPIWAMLERSVPITTSAQLLETMPPVAALD